MRTLDYISNFYNLKSLRCPLTASPYIIRQSQKNPEIVFTFVDVLLKKAECQVSVVVKGKAANSRKIEFVGRFIEDFTIEKFSLFDFFSIRKLV